MPSKGEFDPILENADRKVKDFLGTLTKFGVEASQIDKEKLENDLRDFEKIRGIIRITHSGTGNRGANLARIFAIVSSLDDAAIEARVWSNLLTEGVCRGNKQSLLFAVAVLRNAEMLKEASNQLFHPGLRMMSAGDEIMRALADATSKGQTKQH